MVAALPKRRQGMLLGRTLPGQIAGPEQTRISLPQSYQTTQRRDHPSHSTGEEREAAQGYTGKGRKPGPNPMLLLQKLALLLLH